MTNCKITVLLFHDSFIDPNHTNKRQSGSFELIFLGTIYYRCGRKPQPSMKMKTYLIIILSIHLKLFVFVNHVKIYFQYIWMSKHMFCFCLIAHSNWQTTTTTKCSKWRVLWSFLQVSMCLPGKPEEKEDCCKQFICTAKLYSMWAAA